MDIRPGDKLTLEVETVGFSNADHVTVRFKNSPPEYRNAIYFSSIVRIEKEKRIPVVGEDVKWGRSPYYEYTLLAIAGEYAWINKKNSDVDHYVVRLEDVKVI